MKKTLHWDFFGPNALRTAEHFQHHLDEFLLKNGCTGAQSGLSSAGAGHQAVFCRVDERFEDAVIGALRPKRIT